MAKKGRTILKLFIVPDSIFGSRHDSETIFTLSVFVKHRFKQLQISNSFFYRMNMPIFKNFPVSDFFFKNVHFCKTNSNLVE